MRKIFIVIGLLFLFSNFAFADVPIYCPYTHKHIYNYKKDEIIAGDELKAENFEPADKDIPEPIIFTIYAVCPICKAPLNGYLFWAWKKGQPIPKMFYPGVTLLTKDKEGNFIWKPYDINIKE